MSDIKKKKIKKKTSASFIPQIYVGEDKMSIAKTVKAQVALLALPTPQKYILQRQGPGGLVLDYVETNYVIGRLNATFFFNWDSEILEQIIYREERQIAVKIRLIVRFANGKEVKKDAWGGSEIKWTKDGKKMVDFADDLKSAESDGIKKAASMLGICWDVYAGLTPGGKKKKKFKNETDDGFTDMPGAPDVKSEFRTIPIMINKKKIMHTKYEALDRFKKAKEKLGDKIYYKILGEHGYEKSNQITQKDVPKIYYAMADAYKMFSKTEKSSKDKSRLRTEEKKAEDEKKDKEKTEALITKFPENKDKKEEVQSEQKKVNKEEMPLQRDIMALTRIEAILVDKYRFTPTQIIEKLEEKYGESNLSKFTKRQIDDAIKYFNVVIETLEEKKIK